MIYDPKFQYIEKYFNRLNDQFLLYIDIFSSIHANIGALQENTNN